MPASPAGSAPSGGSGLGFDPITAGLGLAQTVMGIIQSSKAQKEINKLKSQRKAYQTPEEIFKMLQMTQSRASTGYDPATLDYLTNQTDRAFDSTLDTARYLGADPNTLGAAFDQKVNSIMKIGAENHALNMENVNKLYDAYQVVASNRAAEWRSQQDMIKDDLQAASGNKQAGLQNIGGGINTFIAGQANTGMEKLFTDEFGDAGTGAYKYAKENNMTFNEYKRKAKKVNVGGILSGT